MSRLSRMVVPLALLAGACGGNASIQVDELALQAGRFDALPDLRGTWARLEVTSTVSQVPLLGELRTVQRAFSIVRLDGEPDALTTSTQTCAVELESDNGSVHTIVPEAYARSMTESPATTIAALEGERVVIAPFTTISAAGYDPGTDGYDAGLPTSPDDPRVIDADGDGQPGVTFSVSGMVDGDVYVAARRERQFVTTHVTIDTIDGDVQWSAERTTFGATSGRLARPRDQMVDAQGPNYFLSTRVDDDIACDGLLDRRDVLFARIAEQESSDTDAESR